MRSGAVTSIAALVAALTVTRTLALEVESTGWRGLVPANDNRSNVNVLQGWTGALATRPVEQFDLRRLDDLAIADGRAIAIEQDTQDSVEVCEG